MSNNINKTPANRHVSLRSNKTLKATRTLRQTRTIKTNEILKNQSSAAISEEEEKNRMKM